MMRRNPSLTGPSLDLGAIKSMREYWERKLRRSYVLFNAFRRLSYRFHRKFHVIRFMAIFVSIPSPPSLSISLIRHGFRHLAISRVALNWRPAVMISFGIRTTSSRARDYQRCMVPHPVPPTAGITRLADVTIKIMTSGFYFFDEGLKWAPARRIDDDANWSGLKRAVFILRVIPIQEALRGHKLA